VLGVIEQRALFTRKGAGGCAQVDVTGMIAAAFTHWDSRTGDPNLHTHVVVANKVRDDAGVWRSLDSRTLHHAAVFASELYDDLVADHLSARLPVRWGWRERGSRRTPAFELDGVDDPLLAAFSTRSADIDRAVQQSVTDFYLDHGRRPTRPEVVRLRQTATLATRPVKTPHNLTDLLTSWAATARRVTGRDPDALVAAVIVGRSRRRLRAEWISNTTTRRLAEAALDDVMARRSTWNSWNVLASAARVTKGLRMVSTADRLTLIDRVHQQALDLSVPLSATDPLQLNAAELHRSDGGSVFSRSGEATYSHPDLLAAEAHLLQAHDTSDSPAVPASIVQRALTAGHATGRRLTLDQAHAVDALATSGRRLDVLVGPAGTGKTTTLRMLRTAWEASHGKGSVIGLAPSATAAHELSQALGIPCENVAKWLTETAPQTLAERQAILARLPHRHAEAAARHDHQEVRRLDRLAARVRSDIHRWTLHPGQLLIVDEASLAGTLDLDLLLGQVEAADAKLLLVGDHHQLSAIDAGGAFGLLARSGRSTELSSLWRFRHRWEAQASRRLRHGDEQALAPYDAHGRIHQGSAEAMVEEAYAAWLADETTGHSTLLAAVDTTTVTSINQRTHIDRVAAGTVTGPTLTLQAGGCGPDRGSVGAGDRILTRRNDRRLTVPGRGHVHNGDLWTVLAVHPDGSLDVTPHPVPAERQHVSAVRLPSAYVAEHVDLGYAVTVHRAQGVTVDNCHVIVTGSMTRESFYVAMTRGRDANTVYVGTDTLDPECHVPHSEHAAMDGLELLVRTLRTTGAEQSATETAQTAADELGSLRRLSPIRATLAATIDHRRWPHLLTTAGMPAGAVETMLDSPASGPLFAALRRGEHLGHRMDTRAVSLWKQTQIDDSDDPAAALYHRVERWLATAPDLTDGPRKPAHTLAIADRVGPVGDPLDGALESVDVLIDARIDHLKDDLQAGPVWLGSRHAMGSSDDRARLAVVAAHRDLLDPGQDERTTSRTSKRRDRQAALALHRLQPDQPRRIA
jgi:hypothetical protein